MERFDCIVVGAGGVGCAALAHLSRRGLRVLGLDRFPPGHDRGSSHGRTRAIRKAYFEHPNYVPLLVRAYELWAALSERVGEQLYVPAGVLQVGPSDGIILQGVLQSAKTHGLAIESLDADETRARWPQFELPDGMAAVFERDAGYLKVEAAVRAHARVAVDDGATLLDGVEVRRWCADGGGYRVETTDATYVADRLVLAAGAWAPSICADLAIELTVRRKSLFWFDSAEPAWRDPGCPVYLFETPGGIFYGFPHDEVGVKVAEHSRGQDVADPLEVDRDVDAGDAERMERFIATHLPSLAPAPVDHAVCMYTMSADEHFIVGAHPGHPGVTFAMGLSGHGFKFAAVLGEILADLVIDGRTRHPIEFLSPARFSSPPR